jgi:hypothetical protein
METEGRAVIGTGRVTGERDERGWHPMTAPAMGIVRRMVVRRHGALYPIFAGCSMGRSPAGGMLREAALWACPPATALRLVQDARPGEGGAVSPLISLSPPAATAVKGVVHGVGALDRAARG